MARFAPVIKPRLPAASPEVTALLTVMLPEEELPMLSCPAVTRASSALLSPSTLLPVVSTSLPPTSMPTPLVAGRMFTVPLVPALMLAGVAEVFS